MPTLRPLASSSSTEPLAEPGHDTAEAAKAAATDTPAPAAPRPRGTPADPQKYAVIAAPSAIDGLGAFAAEFIPARRKIGEIRGESIPTTEAYARARAAAREGGRIYMIALSERRTLDATAGTDVLRHANHACEPNTVLKVQQGRVAFYALRDIQPGEELTARYGPTHHGGKLVCRCGSPRCIGRL
ncbi:MAG: SET domain-containing protein [Pseudomonadota bacterium]